MRFLFSNFLSLLFKFILSKFILFEFFYLDFDTFKIYNFIKLNIFYFLRNVTQNGFSFKSFKVIPFATHFPS